MKEEEIPVLFSQAIVEKKIPVAPEAVYVIEVLYSLSMSLKYALFQCTWQYLFIWFIICTAQELNFVWQ